MDFNEFKLDLQAVLEKAKSIANIKRDIKIIEAKLPKIKLQGTLNSTSTKKELNTKLKTINPKVKIDADTTQAEKKIRKINQQKSNPMVTPTVDNSQVVSGLKQAQKETKTLWERFTNGIFGINLIRMGIQEITRAIHQAISNIKELDAIKTNIQMVSGTSDSGVNAMMSDYNSMAKDLSSTTKEVAEAANEFLRMGESVASTNELIKSSQVLSKVGMIESAESASYLISSLKGYQVAAQDSMDIVSKLTSVDLEAAVSAGGLAEALSKCANIANNSGVAMDRLIGYTAIVGETTQKSMSEVGNSFQALLSRMNNIKIGRFIDDETGESLSDTEAVLNKLGIQLRDTENTYRSFDAVLDDIGSRWREFTKVEQNAISVAIAGTRQRENFEALMNNYGNALKYAETAANSAGSALERYGIYQDSIQAKTNELTTAMESLSTNVISEELYSGIIEATTGVVEFIDKTNLLKGTLAGLVAMGISKTIASIGAGFITAAKNTAQLTAAMALFDNGRSVTNLKAIGAACKGLSDQQLKLVLSTKGLTDSQRLQILAGMGVVEAERQQTLTTLGFAAAEDKATLSTFLLKGALNSLWTAIAMNPVTAVVTAVSAAITIFSVYKQHVVEASEATKEAIEAFESISSEVESLEDKLSDLNEQINQLDPITDTEDIANLQLETEELEKQLAILKEKQRIASADADKSAQKSLGMAEASRYKTEDRESAYGGVETGAAYVTKDEELLNAIEAYEEYKAKVDEANDALAHMAETGDYTKKEWDEQEKVVSTYSDKMDDARAHANELAVSLDEQKQGLNGSTDASQALFTKIEDVITQYDQWLNLINGTTEALEEQEQTEEEVSNKPFNLSAQLTSSKESLDKFQSSVQSAADAYTTLLSGNYSSSELLRSIQTINQAVSDMGGSLNWEFINSQTDSLELLGDAIQHVSQKYAESILSDAGIDINSEFGQMLANIIQQIYDAETAFEGMNSQLDSLQSSYQTLTDILESYNKTGYITLDNLQSLLTADENLIQMLEVENGQLVLNQAAYENLVAVQLQEFKAKLNDAAAAEIETLAKNKAEQATNQNADASQNAVEKLDAETQAFNRNTTAAIANAVAKAEESGVSETEIQGIFDKYNEIWNAAVSNFSGDFDGFMGGAAGKAGKEHADEYVKAFEKEYSNLKDMLNRGEISEAQYLNKLRALYNKYFRDRKKYLSEFKKYESEYLTGMLDLHNKALSGISTLLNRRISAANDSKSAAIDAISEEKEARLDAINAEKEAKLDLVESKKKELEAEEKLINKQIAAKNKVIEGIREEIDAMRSANEQKKQAINLQQDEYNLQKMLNQRSKQVYKDGQFVFETDTSGIREAKQKVEDDKLEIAITNKEKEIKLIEKEIDLLNDKKDAISEQISLLDEEIDRINDYYDEMIKDTEKYYDNLIKQQEKYWDSIIKGMEQTKSRYEELAEVEEIAKAFSYIQQVFGDLGYTVEDVLNGSDAAFEDFKSRYISLISDVNNNSDFTEGLVYATGVAKENLGSFLDKTKETAEGLDELGDKGSEMDSVADGMDKLSDSASSASTSTEGLSDNLSTINDTLTAIPESDKFDSLTTSFTNLGDAIKGVATALGVGEEGTVGGLVSALQGLSELSLGEEENGIVSQFNNLKTAVEDVTNAISGGGGESSEGDGSGGGSGKGGKSGDASSEGESGGSGNSLTGAIKEMGETAKEVIGESDAEGDGTVIGEFGSMKTAVNDVTTAISGGDSEGGEGSNSEGDSGNLIGSIVDLGETTHETLGEPDGDGVIGKFEQFKQPIQEADEHVHGISDGLAAIDGQEVECTIRIKVESDGFPAYASGTALGAMNLNSAEYNAKYTGNAHVSGTANVTGNWGVRKPGKSLVGELGQEIWVHSADGTFETVGDNGPEWIKTAKGDLIFNHLQTKELLDKGNIVKTGKAYANGNIQYSDGMVIRPNGEVLEPYDPDKDNSDFSKFYKAWNAYYGDVNKNVGEINKKLSQHLVIEHNQKVNKEVDQFISNSRSIVNNTRNVQQSVINGGINITCPGVTSKEVAQQVGVEVGRIFNGMHLEAEQRSRMR